MTDDEAIKRKTNCKEPYFFSILYPFWMLFQSKCLTFLFGIVTILVEARKIFLLAFVCFRRDQTGVMRKSF